MVKNTKFGMVGRLLTLALLLVSLIGMPSSLLAEQKIEEMTVAGETYTDVTITSKNDLEFWMTHSRGIANIKVIDLDDETRVLLGYDEPRPERSMPELDIGGLGADGDVDAMREQMMAEFQKQFGDLNIQTFLIGFAVFGLFMYLFVCYCFSSICKKAGHEPGILVWLPILQTFPILKAAGMPAYWFFIYVFAAIAPVASVPLLESLGPMPVLAIVGFSQIIAAVGSIMWCFKICEARGVGMWVGVLLLLPFTNVLAFLYLAFGKASHDPEVPSKAKTEVWAKKTNQDTSFFSQ